MRTSATYLSLPDQKSLLSEFQYDSETGCLYRRGVVAGYKRHSDGYIYIGFRREKHLAQVKTQGKSHYLGLFLDLDDAALVVQSFYRAANFSPIHGLPDSDRSSFSECAA